MDAAAALADALREGSADEYSPRGRAALADRPESCSSDEQHGTKLLHNQKAPTLEIVHEKPHHLVIAYMVASGMSMREISLRQKVSESHLSNLCRQPWFVARTVEIIQEAGQDAITTLLKGAAVDSVMKVIYLRDHAKSETVQFNSAEALLNRYLGKSPEGLKPEDDSLDDPVAEEARLTRELERLDSLSRTKSED